jgi:hypothetical protein
VANVTIQFGNNPSCTRKAPTVTISPTSLQSANAGENKTYNVNITNNDSAACIPSLFSITSSKSSTNMTVTPSVNSLTIAPGNNASLNAIVSTTVNTPGGIYLFALLARNTTSNLRGGVTGGLDI